MVVVDETDKVVRAYPSFFCLCFMVKMTSSCLLLLPNNQTASVRSAMTDRGNHRPIVGGYGFCSLEKRGRAKVLR